MASQSAKPEGRPHDSAGTPAFPSSAFESPSLKKIQTSSIMMGGGSDTVTDGLAAA
jgi:hypothetical protein